MRLVLALGEHLIHRVAAKRGECVKLPDRVGERGRLDHVHAGWPFPAEKLGPELQDLLHLRGKAIATLRLPDFPHEQLQEEVLAREIEHLAGQRLLLLIPPGDHRAPR
eukprot:scaffold94_cov254-Pinguiococcus_pyrenoidosus.AAC.3